MVYINGEYFKKEEAKVSVFDRGFLYSDGVYEVVPLMDGKFLFFAEHLLRLKRSCREIKMNLPELNYLEISQKLAEQSGMKNGFLYLQITRGASLERSHVWKPGTLQPTVVIFCQTVSFAPRLLEYEKLEEVPKEILSKVHLKALVAEDIRWDRCDIKSIALLPNVLLRFDSAQKGCDETIFTKNGLVTEGSSTNVFVVKKGVVRTPPLKANILPGVTRLVLLKALKKAKIKYVEGPVKASDLMKADEVWLSSSTKDVLPVIKIGSKKIGKGIAGPVWFKAYKTFQGLK